MNALSARERKLVAIGILVAIVASVHLAIVSPILGGFAERAGEREALLAAYARNARAINGIPALRAQAAAQRKDAARFAMSAPNAAAASAQLQERLGALVTAAGGELKAVQEVSTGGGWARAWAECRLTLPQLTQLLQQMQDGQPYLVVESLTVAADRSFQTGKLDLMDVRVEATGAYSIAQPR